MAPAPSIAHMATTDMTNHILHRWMDLSAFCQSLTQNDFSNNGLDPCELELGNSAPYHNADKNGK